MKASGSMLQVLKCRKNNIQRRRLVEFIGAGEGIRIHHSLKLSQVIQQFLSKLYCNSIELLR